MAYQPTGFPSPELVRVSSFDNRRTSGKLWSEAPVEQAIEFFLK
jgi:hypothetical protein